MLTCLNYIGGQWLPAESRENLESRNPANWHELVATFPRCDAPDADAAVAAAIKGFETWRHFNPPQRGEYIYRIGELLIRDQEKIANLIAQEMGKPLRQALFEVREAANCAFYYAGEGRRLFGQTISSQVSDTFALTVRVPVGVCVLITPWNFPVGSLLSKALPALICGNSIIFKPAEDTPACAHVVVELFEQAGFPPGVVNLVHGLGEEIGAALVEHPGVDLVSFTGASTTGAMVAQTCGSTLKRVSLEMTGKNAQVVMEDADLQLAVEGTLWGSFATAGQRCTATSRLILHRQIKEKFLALFSSRTSQLRLGAGTDASTQIGPLVNGVELQRVIEYIELARCEGVEVLTGGERAIGGNLRTGFFFEPTILDNVKPDSRLAVEEIFGPVVVVMEVDSFEEAIALVNDTSYGLSASIYTQNVNRAFAAIRDFEVGIVYINGPTIATQPHLPFGGMKYTGNGDREGGTAVLNVFSELKTVYVDFSGRLQLPNL